MWTVFSAVLCSFLSRSFLPHKQCTRGAGAWCAVAVIHAAGQSILNLNTACTENGDCRYDRDRPDQEMIPDLEITPEDIAEAALLPFRMSKNVVLEVRLHAHRDI